MMFARVAVAAIFGLGCVGLSGMAAECEQTPAERQLQQTGCQMTALGDKGCSGQNLSTDAGLSCVSDQWDDKIASIKVEHWVWRLFGNADYHVDLALGEWRHEPVEGQDRVVYLYPWHENFHRRRQVSDRSKRQ